MADSIYNIKIEDNKENKDKTSSNNSNNFNTCGYGILAFLFLIITSDVFGEIVLSTIPGAVEGRTVTTLGAIISAIILIIAHMLIMNYL